MKNILLLITFLYTSFLIGQKSVLVPPEAVTTAFEKHYPKKTAYWSIEYGKNDAVYFEGTFTTAEKTKAYALYDSYGAFRSLKTQVPLTKLPVTAQTYLKKNFPVKAKVNPVGRALTVVDAQNTQTYIAEVKKDKKRYNIVFNTAGEFIKKTEIDNL